MKSKVICKYSKLYDKALELMDGPNPDLNRVNKMLTTAFERRDPRAAYALGTWYLHGQYVKKNIRTALKYLRFSAKCGEPAALFDLAVCYESGIGVKRNESKAYEYYLKAALFGDEQSVYEVGRCLYYGTGTSKNRKEAGIWLDRAKTLALK